MKKIIVILGIAILILGCAPKTQSVMGSMIDPIKVEAIQKNVTTADQIVQNFGPPMNKAMVDGGETWTYMFYSSESSTTSLTTAQVTGRQQKLDLLIKDGIVVNYVYNDGPVTMQGSTSF